MGGAVKGLTKAGLVRPVSATKKSDKPDLNVEAGGKPTGPKADFGLTNLGESKSQTEEDAVTTVGSVPFRRKKPTITLLGNQP
jgi:hypothetical protein